MDAVIVEFGNLYTRGYKPKKIMEMLGIDYATYKKLYRQWKKRKTEESGKKEETEREKPEFQEEEEEKGKGEEQTTEEDSKPDQEEESNNESYEEECYREHESQKESKNQSSNTINYDEIENKELKEFFDVGDLEVKGEDEADEEDEEEDTDVDKIVGDAKETILFLLGIWLFLLSLKYPGDWTIKLDFVNTFMEKRERQIKRMVDKIDRVLRRYAKIYKLLVDVKDWTFMMDVTILTMTFQSELEEKIEESLKETEENEEKSKAIDEELPLGHDDRLLALIGGAKYASNV
jgi:hypothetical protein